jgi:hypothetical protein
MPRRAVSYATGEPTGWLEATLAGTTAPTDVSIRADPSNLSAGTYRADVEVIASDADNSPQVIEVTFEVEAALPAILVDPEAVGFAMAEGEADSRTPGRRGIEQRRRRADGAGGGISYADGEPTGWLEAELVGTTAPTALTLSVDPTGLASPAVFDAVVEVTSPVAESSGRVQVRFRLGEPPPEIDLDPTEIGWAIVENDESPPTRAVAIENRGTGTLGGLSAEVVYGAGAADGVARGGRRARRGPGNAHRIAGNTALLPGSYEATIQVLSDDAINSPQSVAVSLQVAPRASPEFSTITASPTVHRVPTALRHPPSRSSSGTPEATPCRPGETRSGSPRPAARSLRSRTGATEHTGPTSLRRRQETRRSPGG